MSVIRQPSLLGAEAARPEPADLAGLLAAGGQVGRASGAVQISVTVDHPWRAAVLVAECARRGLAATCVSTVSDHIGVRTAHSPLLLPLADAWTEGSSHRAPRGFLLTGQVLRLWVVAAGHCERDDTYVLSVGHQEDASRATLGAALAAVGVPAQLVSPRTGSGPSYRIVGKRRLVRLAEMVGDPPKQAPATIWPS
jgi:hypothetical protein